MQTLSEREVEQVGGAVTWQQIGVGVGLIALGVSIAATGGLSGLAIGVIAGAGTAGELGVAGMALGLAGAGGATIGNGMSH